MADIVSPQKRSQMMAGIKAKNTKPELLIRSGLHACGYRFRLHRTDLPGRPDIVLPRYRAAIFVNGCFWHRHNCHLFKLPRSRREFWTAKLDANAERDQIAICALRSKDWRVAVIWECATRGKNRLHVDETIRSIGEWLNTNDQYLEIEGETLDRQS